MKIYDIIIKLLGKTLNYLNMYDLFLENLFGCVGMVI